MDRSGRCHRRFLPGPSAQGHGHATQLLLGRHLRCALHGWPAGRSRAMDSPGDRRESSRDLPVSAADLPRPHNGRPNGADGRGRALTPHKTGRYRIPYCGEPPCGAAPMARRRGACRRAAVRVGAIRVSRTRELGPDRCLKRGEAKNTVEIPIERRPAQDRVTSAIIRRTRSRAVSISAWDKAISTRRELHASS